MNTIALVGNPNSGKTTLFNALTGTNQHVGNWPGVTVEKKEGTLDFNGKKYNIVDLPGTYSLGAYSEDEVVARDFIMKDDPDIVINVVDATNIERNLYLTTQLLEMGTKVIIALNMMDEAKEKNISIDIKKLSKELGVPVIATVASKKNGIDDLVKEAIDFMGREKTSQNKIDYGKDIDLEINRLKEVIENANLNTGYPSEWIAIKLLEGDEYISKIIDKNILNIAQKSSDTIAVAAMEPELIIVDKRYEFIGNIVNKAVKKPKEEVITKSDKIDKVLTHKWFGLPIFALIMLAVYQLTFAIGEDILQEGLNAGMEALTEAIEGFLISVNAPELLTAFITDGILGGVGAVVEFVPLIMVLYLLLGILEDSGYMARAAYVMDRIMRSVGLHGKTFISMLVGVGCNVPGIMATRTLDSKKDRMIAILINPFISCGARLPIYLVFISAFFPKHKALILFSIYAFGFLVAIIMGKIFSKTLFEGESSYFVMELPPYRIPTLKGTLLNMWDKVSSFLKRAGTVIFAVVTVLWVLSVLPYGVEPYSEASILGKIGTFIAPIFKPAGFGTWQASVGLFAGIVAKEAVVATLGMVYAGVEEGAKLISAVQGAFTPLSAISFMAMTLLYTPCAAVIGTIKRETNSTKWAAFTAFYTFAIGWIVSVLIFQIGRLFGLS
ncbi:ferrous iron transport protein B [Anaerosalibacter bizertensis]|uniref:Ferrous iron transport protein B n=1 Tax=Anaerosalibacter bizertensis TaxID=932217 RepID=A0A844FHN6_9FIRM|nr:ferrous iron transport protein B [Anaerosalibacter bizertensis]MBV1819939.1 ferrous iron transport protein B [Bacteroidales bacterium MSK.15.36]HHV25921.1 ferrous iron transport protein B [Tissierellia bacterium]MBU5294619.1 ferrous iron transport protein B [Anaerosalibacter bizertensis]MCB5558954.1 ferrous iron transport protein B [Anaerosalibacter bizertensis]MCG4565288.1 ferrous iron transport protein B [Anaerosalibacter bizertensis]